MQYRNGAFLAATAATLLAAAPWAAHAQQSPADSAERGGDSSGLAEVVVTAEKRLERAQETPISLTAISGADLQAQGISNTEDIARGIPGVALVSAGPGQTEYTIRGMPSSGAVVATVGFYLDEAPMTAPAGAQNGHVVIDPDLYDLNRIEVLRGPQGTLYGAGSMGGTIKLVTNQPDVHSFAASAKVDGSSTHAAGLNSALNGMLNIPLLPGTAALRLVATDEHTSGWIDRVVLANFPLPTNPEPRCQPFAGCSRGNVLGAAVSADYPGSNASELKGGRASLRYEATEQLSLTATAFYQTITQSGLSYFDTPPGTEAHYQPFNFAEPFSDTFRLYNLVATYSFPDVELNSATSYWTRTQSQDQDVSETIQSLLNLPGYTVSAGGVGPVGYLEIDGTKQFSEEIRATSIGHGALQWLLGGFFANYHYVGQQYSLADGFGPLFGSPNLFTGYFTNDMKQTAAFGEASYRLTPQLKLTAGLRYYSYTQGGSNAASGIATGSFTPLVTRVGASNSGLNPKFTLAYELTPDTMVYTTAAKGFRPGAGNQAIPTSGADSCLPDLQALGKNSAPLQYGPDSVWSYELGEKASLADRRVTLNSSVYYERWTKVQQSIALACGFSYLDNVGTNSIRGGELELNARIASAWTIAQSVGYTRATVTDTQADSGLMPGQKLLNVPDYTSSTALVYSHSLGGYLFTALASDVLVGPSQALTYSLIRVPGYNLVRLRTALAADRWSVGVFIDNVMDRQPYLAYTSNYALQFPSLNRVSTSQPRTVGLTLEWRR